MRRFHPLPWAGRNLKSDPVAVSQKDYRSRGAASRTVSFMGVWKHIRDSICYLYSNPNTMYTQLMVTACKAESQNEEAQDKVWARSIVTTNPVEGASELENQVAKLTVALTKAGQGNSQGSAPNSPRHRGHWRGRQIELLLVTPIPTMAKLVWDRPFQPTAYLLVMDH